MTEAFDLELNKTADVLMRPSGGDTYGAQSNNLVKVGTAVPCRVSLGKGRPHEAKTPLKSAKNYREVFMRPFVDANGNALSHKNWLQIEGLFYDILQVDDPGGLGHHLEVWCELILT
jgi:hypothetical protein